MSRKQFLFIFLFFYLMYLSAAFPVGVSNISIINSSAYSFSSTPENASAFAGNITELNIFGDAVTKSWQGYFGNITGTIQLADAANKVLYNWSLASPRGEVFASTANPVAWSNLVCFNWTLHNGPQLETSFGIGPNDVDGVNETFTYADSHSEFFVANKRFEEGTCRAVFLYENGVKTNQRFQNVLLTDGTNTVFGAILEQDRVGFDGKSHDFQMIVLENGHADDTNTTTYYFWVELE